MSNNLKIFKYGLDEVRITLKDNEPWFVGKDICNYFGDTNYRRSLSKLDEDEKGVSRIDTPGGLQKMTVINEPGLYSLLFSMQPQQANLPKEQYQERIDKIKKFKRWITHEVIPSIRKHGAYMTPETIEKTLTDPDFIIGLANRLKDEQKKTKQLENKINKDKPKVYFANEVASSNTTILVGEMAKLLNQMGIDTGQNRFYKWLRENGYVIKRRGQDNNLPTQRSMDLGIMRIKESTIERGDTTMITKTTMITGKGQRYFIEKFRKMQEEKLDAS